MSKKLHYEVTVGPSIENMCKTFYLSSTFPLCINQLYFSNSHPSKNILPHFLFFMHNIKFFLNILFHAS